jgi:hypothetical protein
MVRTTASVRLKDQTGAGQCRRVNLRSSSTLSNRQPLHWPATEHSRAQAALPAAALPRVTRTLALPGGCLRSHWRRERRREWWIPWQKAVSGCSDTSRSVSAASVRRSRTSRRADREVSRCQAFSLIRAPFIQRKDCASCRDAWRCQRIEPLVAVLRSGEDRPGSEESPHTRERIRAWPDRRTVSDAIGIALDRFFGLCRG